MPERTLPQLFEDSVRQYPDRILIWEKKADQYQGTTYSRMRLLVHEFAAGLMRLGLIGAVLVAGPFPAVAAVTAIVAAVTALVAAAALAEVAALAEIAALTHLPTAHLAAAGLGALVVAFVSFGVPARLAIAAVRPLALMAAMLRPHLRLRGHDDAIVVLGVLEIALRRDHVAGRERVAGERHVLLGDMRRRAPDFHVGAVRFVVPRQWILGLAAAATAPAILLSLSHVPFDHLLSGLAPHPPCPLFGEPTQGP